MPSGTPVDWWYVSLHSAGGSTVEAAEPMVAVGPMLEAEARLAYQGFTDWVRHHRSQYVQTEWFAVLGKLTRPVAMPAAPTQAGAGPNQKVIDLSKFLDDFYTETHGDDY